MSNNTALVEIKQFIESIFIDNLQLNLAELRINIELFQKEKSLNIVIEIPQNLISFQTSIENKIQNELDANFKIFDEIKLIFTAPKNAPANQKIKHSIPNVKRIILIAAAKGGVGKSTTTVNVAKALSKLGYKVGVVDADIYGPTIPKLLGIDQKPETKDGKMLPIYKDNIYSISIGYIVNDSQAAIWRGPMISKALYQLLVGVIWPELDYLIIDMPPGTGDIYLSLAENFKIDGVVLITTPQNIATSMLKKSISFFNKTNIPILGIIQNMSFFVDNENNKHYIFGNDPIINEFHVLEEIPISPKISKFSDEGKDLSQEEEFKVFIEIAKKII